MFFLDSILLSLVVIGHLLESSCRAILVLFLRDCQCISVLLDLGINITRSLLSILHEDISIFLGLGLGRCSDD